MSPRALIYLLFTFALLAVFAGIVVYTFRGSRRDRVEEPKYRMLRDDPGPAGEAPSEERG